MAYSDYPSATPREPETSQNQNPKRDNRKLVYGVLIAALLATWAYFIYDHTQDNKNFLGLQKSASVSDSIKNAVETEYNVALQRMDSLTGSNTQLHGALSQQKSEIDSLREQIEQIRREDHGDLTRAKDLVDQLNQKVNALNSQVASLKQENATLAASNQTLALQRDTLIAQNKNVADSLQTSMAENRRIVDEASTLHASDMKIQAINAKGSTTTKASKTDLLRISFTIDENRVASSGDKSLYIIITAPNGRVISNPAEGSGTFQTHEDGERVYTKIQTINYTQGERQNVSLNWRAGTQYQPGNYTIEVYNNGYKIGEGMATLQKSGFLGL